MKLHQPHDKLFRETFGDVEVAEDFLTHYLPEALLEVVDLKSLEMLNDSFIEEKLQDSQSDLLYETMIDSEKAYVYFLFEHKSYPTKDIALQLLGYMLEIWKREVDKKKAEVLPFVVPLVIYHGKSRWENPRLSRDWMVNYDDFSVELTKVVPDFEFWLFDFSYENDLEIHGDVKLQAYLKLMQHIFLKDWEEIIQALIEIEALLLGYGYDKYFITMTIYIIGSRKNVPIDEIQRKLSEEGRKIFMTTAEQLKREGELIGEKKGEKRRNYEIIKNALNLDMKVEQIVKLTGLSSKEVEKIIREVK